MVSSQKPAAAALPLTDSDAAAIGCEGQSSNNDLYDFWRPRVGDLS